MTKLHMDTDYVLHTDTDYVLHTDAGYAILSSLSSEGDSPPLHYNDNQK